MSTEPPVVVAPLPRFTADDVRKARQLLGWRQIDLAFKAGVTEGTLSRLESGLSVRTLTLAKIAATLVIAGIVRDLEGAIALQQQP